MQTRLADAYRDTPEGRIAESVLRACVHCGFCNATCPTHRVLGDELDGPRGRIYLMKQVFEGAQPTRATQLHLDRCIGCRHCESTCPSGVEYGKLWDVGQQVVDSQVERPWPERTKRWLMRKALPSPFFGPALKLGQAVRGWLPAPLRELVPDRPPLAPPQAPTAERQAMHTRQVVMLKGCVQRALRPHIDLATRRVLDAIGVRTTPAPGSGCCGALQAHLGDAEGARARMRQNIDAWWPWIEGQGSARGVRAEALIVNATGCGSMIKDYGHWLADDPAYAEKARRVSAWARDLGDWLADQGPALRRRQRGRRPVLPGGAGALADLPPLPTRGSVAWHPPCSLTHAQKQSGRVESLLQEMGYEVRLASADPTQCCGAGGAYSVLQGELSRTLRADKLQKLEAADAAVIVSANIGCITHLQAGTSTPVKHWIELVDEALSPGD
ncbi:MAG: glycolate oxidase iron-sulfur subunit [Aquabacterium sp.]|jgi:glycolate oxidase iron-sulfur subunit|nr:MAG: glycolate oxidase iron-sulfur subunit [Aquabacterium sp.]